MNLKRRCCCARSAKFPQPACVCGCRASRFLPFGCCTYAYREIRRASHKLEFIRVQPDDKQQVFQPFKRLRSLAFASPGAAFGLYNITCFFSLHGARAATLSYRALCVYGNGLPAAPLEAHVRRRPSHSHHY